MINTSIKYLKEMQTESGLFRASRKNVDTGYDRIWIRDNLYISLAFEAIKDKKTVEQIYHRLLDLFIKFQWKINDVIKEKPTEDYKFLHPLYTENLEEIKEGWGWKQNDSIGGFLYFVGYLQKQNYNIIRNKADKNIINKLAKYLNSIQYWKDKDNGIWEENKEVHSSSVGACVAGLKEISHFTNVPKQLIEKGQNTLNNLLPKESITKDTDLSLLSLVYPYNVVDEKMAITILNNIEKNLIRKKGIIRYPNDKYYYDNKEASWTMGFPWMAICYRQLGNINKYKEYVEKTISTMNTKLELPELYIRDTRPNKNTPLGWSQSLIIKALAY
jgi:phosphorylase kinase alpha/beta subunit